ncbi:MAG: right-handed parallel beta-helix repeat-containing protein [Alphaproteobacteria bacterium]|nr:right-handed parallel beta-helix repeat-containing protein [Alphaproteobacteria bacterium]
MAGLRDALPMLLLALAQCAMPMATGPAAARTLEVGETREFKMPSEAIRAAKDGDRVVIDPGEYFDCAVVSANNLTIEGAKPDASAVMTDKTCQGKALLVTTGKGITLRNLTLQRARVPDNNGAGIRVEGANLTIERVKFINNQNGILAANNPESTITIRDSEFLRNGFCSPCAHGIYVNQVKLLRIERSRFADTRRAHHIKSRALRTEIIGVETRDGDSGTASYHIEIPNGGSVVVRDSTMQKGPQAENRSAMIMIGAEGVSQPTREITIENNTAINTGDYETFMVVNLTATEAMLKGNRLTGPVKPLRGDGEVR